MMADLVQWLLQQSPRAVNATNISGRTPLHIAAQRNNVEMCEVLIDYGAFVNPLMVNAKVKKKINNNNGKSFVLKCIFHMKDSLKSCCLLLSRHYVALCNEKVYKIVSKMTILRFRWSSTSQKVLNSKIV